MKQMPEPTHRFTLVLHKTVMEALLRVQKKKNANSWTETIRRLIVDADSKPAKAAKPTKQ